MKIYYFFTQENKVDRYVPISALKLNVKKHNTLP